MAPPITFTDWLEKHTQALAYLNKLVKAGNLSEGQELWIIKYILRDENGFNS